MSGNSYPIQAQDATHPYLFYEKYGNLDDVVQIDEVLNNIVPLLAKGESAINAQLADLATIDPGQLDQSRLMSAQMNMSRWQLAAQLLSNFASGVASGLKNTVQNVGR
jgi:hypothetical protein